ncbi:unnamed protein product [Spirodela intermedia]|uniref:NOG1 N-terminal helical domain-containing protein n=1 Tax=Spirodela intermedia TaxID=51605 RepID=A0ABN7ECJ2_SPIIN|nr:unnamed protein product [Spirodela intermedia]
MSGSGGTFNLLHQLRFPSTRLHAGRGRPPLPSREASLCILLGRVAHSCRRLRLLKRREFPPHSEKPSTMPKMVGAFQNLPMVMPSDDILSSAKRKARRVTPSKGKGLYCKYCKEGENKGAKHLDALMKEIAVPLRLYLANFPRNICYIPMNVLGRVDSLRKKILSVGKEHAALCAQSSTKREAEERLSESVHRGEELEDAFHLQRHAVEDLLKIAKLITGLTGLHEFK